LLAAIGAQTGRIAIGTGVIDMRYGSPFYTLENACAADLILSAGPGRAPEQVHDDAAKPTLQGRNPGCGRPVLLGSMLERRGAGRSSETIALCVGAGRQAVHRKY
jgi:hypothetical protein